MCEEKCEEIFEIVDNMLVINGVDSQLVIQPTTISSAYVNHEPFNLSTLHFLVYRKKILSITVCGKIKVKDVLVQLKAARS